MTRPDTSMSELWEAARQYGRVTLFTNDDGTYHAIIKFNTIAHTQLEAKSDYKRPTPESALQMAIESAQAIVESVAAVAAGLPERKRIA